MKQEVLRALPVESHGSEADHEWTDAKNTRRCELIDKEIDDTIGSKNRLNPKTSRTNVALPPSRSPLPLAHATRLLASLSESCTGS